MSSSASSRNPGSRLGRRLGLGDAITIGLGSMLGAGVFTAIGPAAAAGGTGLLLGLVVAAFVAFCNATSSAALAAVHPASGGAYIYGRARLGKVWGYLAGWGFVSGKVASGAAMALTAGSYAAPSSARPIALTAVAGLTIVNLLGVRKTAATTRVIVLVVLMALGVVVAGAAFGGSASADHFGPLTPHGVGGVFRSAGFLFFAFAGYARIATLGEEVVDPARTIPKAVVRSLTITIAVYAVVALAAIAAAGPDRLASSAQPLATAVKAGDLDVLLPAVRVGGTIAAMGVLLSLIAGVSRTAFAMAADGELPRPLAAINARRGVPHIAEAAVGLLIGAFVAVSDVRGAIGFSSFCVLSYYAIANAAALTLTRDERRWPRALAAGGLLGCLVLAFTLPLASVVAGVGVLGLGLLGRCVLHVFTRSPSRSG